MQNTVEVKKVSYINLEIGVAGMRLPVGLLIYPTERHHGVGDIKMDIAVLGRLADVYNANKSDCKRLYGYAEHFQFFQGATEITSHKNRKQTNAQIAGTQCYIVLFTVINLFFLRYFLPILGEKEDNRTRSSDSNLCFCVIYHFNSNMVNGRFPQRLLVRFFE